MENQATRNEKGYTLEPAMAEAIARRSRQQDVHESGDDGTESRRLRGQREHILDQIRGYLHETFSVLKVAGRDQTKEVEDWMYTQEATEEGVESLRKFYEFQHARLDSGRKLRSKFFQSLDAAKPWISKSNYTEWVERFEDPNANYKQREYWVDHQFASYVKRWETVAKERDTLEKNPKVRMAVSAAPEFDIVLNREKFLNLHYQERVGWLAKLKAYMIADEKGRIELYAKAEAKLKGAVESGALQSGKVGVWLEKILKSKASPRLIEAFVNGAGTNALPVLIERWKHVRMRYDRVKKIAGERKEENAPRGLNILGDQQFLSMHYTQRLRYVEELEHRYGDLPANKERPSFVKIRHAIDIKDWAEATLLIGQTEREELSGPERIRLGSMRDYVTQFSTKAKKMEKGDAIKSAHSKIDQLIPRIPMSMRPMIHRLLRGPNSNRSIHQLRWIVYNNKWCRTHGYLDDEKAFSGAQKDNREMTKYRAEHGMDVGRHDTLDYETADKAYFRKKEFANHKATYLHVNLASGATQTLSEWLEHEQDPKVLYWTTFCGHEDGLPKSANWHNELLYVLGELRSATRTLKNAGFMYDAPGRPLVSLN
jgi:hypothetical protein